MDIKKIIKEEIRKVLKEYAEFDSGTEGEVPRIMQSSKGFVLGMAALNAVGKEYARSIESPYFQTKEEVCSFFAKWDPATATMQESIMAEQSNNFTILGAPEQVCSVNETMIQDNYPAGAQYDSNAPWNQTDNTRKGEKASEINFDVIWNGIPELAIIKDKKGTLYAFNVEMVDHDDFEPYAEREETFNGYDEDGMPDVDYGDWEVDGEVIENYINDNMSEIRVGKGLDDFESGDYEAVTFDEELRQDLLGYVKYVKDNRNKQALIDILGSINEVAEKIVDTPTMDTPTGTLFTISVGE